MTKPDDAASSALPFVPIWLSLDDDRFNFSRQVTQKGKSFYLFKFLWKKFCATNIVGKDFWEAAEKWPRTISSINEAMKVISRNAEIDDRKVLRLHTQPELTLLRCRKGQIIKKIRSPDQSESGGESVLSAPACESHFKVVNFRGIEISIMTRRNVGD